MRAGTALLQGGDLVQGVPVRHYPRRRPRPRRASTVRHYRWTETWSQACQYSITAGKRLHPRCAGTALQLLGNLVPGVPVQPVIGSPPTCLYLYIAIQFEVEMEFLTV